MSNRLTYICSSFPGQSFNATQVRKVAGIDRPLHVANYVNGGCRIGGYLFTRADGVVKPKNTHFGREPRAIHCRCELCGNRQWPIADIKALPNTPLSINPLTLPKASRATGHDFYYPATTPAGTWHKAGAPPKVVTSLPRDLFNGGMPVNPKRFDILFIAGGEGGEG